jgi:hypothetical protein
MRRRITLGCLVAFIFLGCLLPSSLLGGVVNLGAYYLLRKPVSIRDPVRIEQKMDRIGSEVRTLRGYSGAAPVKHALITPAALRTQMTEEFTKEYSREEVQDELEEYAAFGVLDPVFDLYSFYLATYTKYVLGYYDPAQAELYVVAGAGFGASQWSTFAHEYMHALQYKEHNLPADFGSGLDSESAAGIQALIEGEATLVEDMWQSRYFSLGDQVDYYKQSLAALDEDYFRIPSFLKQQIYFPYSEGKSFINYLYTEGGWAEVDAAYRDLPSSTEMILHPEKYLLGEQPIQVPKPVLPETLSGGWHEVRDNIMGEFSIDLILATRMNTLQASQAAAGWGGDRYLILRDDSTGSTAVVWHTQWDTQADAGEFEVALREYDARRFSQGFSGPAEECWKVGVVACQVQTGESVWWFYGPDGETVDRLMKSNLPNGAGFDPLVSPAFLRFFPLISWIGR